MDIEKEIKKLEEERDKLLAETPIKIISQQSTGKGRIRSITNHTSIKTKYNRQIAHLKKYGVKDFHELDLYKEQQRKRMVDKWGNEEFREKTSQAISKAYGKPSYKSRISEARKAVWEREGFREKMCEIFSSDEFDEKRKATWMKRYGVGTPLQRQEIVQKVINSTNRISKINIAFKEELQYKTGKVFELEKDNFDLVYEKTAIEINPSFSHNSTYSYAYVTGRSQSNNPIPKNYHMSKFKKANELGYHLISIFDWDDEYKIIEMFKPKETLYARNCRIKEVPQEECKKFLIKYHLQGTCNKQEIRLGLYKDDELIQLMTFGKPRYNKNYEYELLRLCTKAEYKVVGGAEKLFKYFKENYHPSSIISYCDNSKFNGDVYKRLGFNLKSLGQPSKHWYNIKTHRHITNNLLNQRGFSQLHGDKKYEKAEKGTSNEQLMLEAGYVEIYDCGQSTYVYENIE